MRGKRQLQSLQIVVQSVSGRSIWPFKARINDAMGPTNASGNQVVSNSINSQRPLPKSPPVNLNPSGTASG